MGDPDPQFHARDDRRDSEEELDGHHHGKLGSIANRITAGGDPGGGKSNRSDAIGKRPMAELDNDRVVDKIAPEGFEHRHAFGKPAVAHFRPDRKSTSLNSSH